MPSPKTKAILRQVRPRLAAVHGERLRGVVLFGSEARGDAEADSDIDLLVLLEGPVDVGDEIRPIVDALCPLQLEIPDLPIHALPVDVKDFECDRFLFYGRVKEEAVFP
jgi:predicted nucleotidyltransferase